MIFILNKKVIKFFIIIFENFQSHFNIDIYSILRIKRGNNKKFLEEIFSRSYEKWLFEYNKQKELQTIHNISFNYWIRSHAAHNYYKKDLKIIFYFIYILFNLVNFFFFLIRVLISKIRIKENSNYLDKKNRHNINNFVTYLNNKSYLSVLEYVNKSFDYSLKFSNITLNYQINFYKNNSNNKSYKFKALLVVIKYILNYPFMIKYYKTLFNSFYIYLVFNKDSIFKDKYTLCSEVYSMVSRSISIASLDYRGKCFSIDHSKFDALPYECYSLHRKEQLINIDKIYQKKALTNNNQFKKKKNNLNILVQASDGCGTISSYEYFCNSFILKSLIELKYDGQILFKFHPANSKFSISLKKKLCEYEIKNNINIIFNHQEKNLEFFANNSFLVISIDYSTSFDEIIRNGTPIIYFNFNNQRHTINSTNSIHKSKKFKMITNKESLKIELKNHIQNSINNK